MRAEVKNKKVIVYPSRNSEYGLEGLAPSQPPSPEAGKAVFRHSRRFLLGNLAAIIGRGREMCVPEMWEQM